MPATRLLSTITAVTVFNQGALVSRHADLSGLSDRPRQVRVSGLPLCLDDASVRVACDSAVASDLSVVLEVPDADTTLPPADDTDLRAAVLAEQQAQARLNQVKAWHDELSALTIVKRPQSARGTPPPLSPTAARLTLITFQQERAQRLTDDIARLEEDLRLACERRQTAQAVVDSATNARQTRPDEVRKTVLITLDWPESGKLGTLRLDYLVPGARWTPSYIVRFSPDLAEAQVQLRAAVCQRSGENWSGVTVTLSTADALGWHDLPELPSLRIGRRQAPPAKPGWREPPTGARDLFIDFDRATRRENGVDQDIPEPREDTTSAAMAAARSATKVRDEHVQRKALFAKALSELPDESRKSRRMAPPSAPPPSPVSSSDMMADTLSEEAPNEPPSPSFIEPAATLLDFRHLGLPAPTNDRRGYLRPGQPQENYRLENAPWANEALRVLSGARQAAELRQLAFPVRCQAPNAGLFAYSYVAELPVTIASDGAWHVVPLCERRTTATLTHIVVPREAREVFRVAEFANPLALPLLPGPADVYLGEHFFLAVDLRLTVVGGTVRLGLGVEQGITVARNATFNEDVAGMLRGSLTLDHHVTLDLANKLPRAIALEIRERVPVAHETEKECVVKIGAVTPSWEDYRPTDQPSLPGAHCWRLRLAAGAVQKVSFHYTVTIPAKNEIVGGNRREV